MKTKYVEPKGYWTKDMEKAFNNGKSASSKTKKQAPKKGNKK